MNMSEKEIIERLIDCGYTVEDMSNPFSPIYVSPTGVRVCCIDIWRIGVLPADCREIPVKNKKATKPSGMNIYTAILLLILGACTHERLFPFVGYAGLATISLLVLATLLRFNRDDK